MALIVTAATSATAFAGNDAPQPPEQTKDLQCLIGSWSGAGTLEMGGQKVDLKLSYTCSEVASGFGVGCHGTMVGIPGLDAYDFQDIWGYDPGDGKIHWFTVTNVGETHDHKGSIANNAFVGQFTGKRDGKKFVEKINWQFSDHDNFHVTSVGLLAGKEIEKLQLKVQRDGKRARRASR